MYEQHSAEDTGEQAGGLFAVAEPEIFSLELAISHTRSLGHRVFAKQILVVVPTRSVFRCRKCRRLVCVVETENLSYTCDVSGPDDPEFQFVASNQHVANLLAEHECAVQ